MFDRLKRVLVGLLCICLLGGCTSKEILEETEESVQDPEILNWFTGETVSVQYEVPTERSYIMVDQWGYLPNSEKKFVCTDIMEETDFDVVLFNTGEVVYSGTMKQKDDALTYAGDFSKVNTPGVYVIKTRYLGESYPFAISDTVYDKQLQALVSNLKNAEWTGELEESCMAINSLLLAYELYPNAFLEKSPETGIPAILDTCMNGIQTVLGYQNHKTGEVFPEIVSDTESEFAGDRNLTAVFIGTVAKLCYSLKEYDAPQATELLKYATLSWQFLGKDFTSVSQDRLFFAGAEMYRVTAQYKFRNTVKGILPDTGKISSSGKYDFAFFANITYLMTSSRVEVDYCNRAIDIMIREATKITEESKSEIYLVRNRSAESAILKDAALIVFASRVNYNQEYMTVLENHLHYLSGMNVENLNYFTYEESWMLNSDYGKSMAVLAYSLLTAS